VHTGSLVAMQVASGAGPLQTRFVQAPVSSTTRMPMLQFGSGSRSASRYIANFKRLHELAFLGRGCDHCYGIEPLPECATFSI